jgi:hypothetical protein
MRCSLVAIFVLVILEAKCASGVREGRLSLRDGSSRRRTLKGTDDKKRHGEYLIDNRTSSAGKKGDDDDDDDGSESYGKKGDDDDEYRQCYGRVVVANQGDGTLSILDAEEGDYIRTITLPYDSFTMSKPVPVDVVAVNGMIYVSDYANDRVLAYDGVSYHLEAIISVGQGASEMSTDAAGRYLWVTNVHDVTVIIVDLEYNVPIRSIENFDPSGVVDYGDNIPNDVLVTASGDGGYVTWTGAGGLVVRYDSSGTVRAFNTTIGNQARLAASYRFNCLYVPSLRNNFLYILFNQDLQDSSDFSVGIPSPFDAISSLDGRFIYISSSENNALYTYDVGGTYYAGGGSQDPSLVPSNQSPTIVTTSIPRPTKLATTENRLFALHSATNEVSVFTISSLNPIPIEINVVEVGTNPTGIAYVEPTYVCGSYSDQY